MESLLSQQEEVIRGRRPAPRREPHNRRETVGPGVDGARPTSPNYSATKEGRLTWRPTGRPESAT